MRNYRLVDAGEVNLQSFRFLHRRFNCKLFLKFSFESFLQGYYNQLLVVEQRNLVGDGLRFNWVNRELQIIPVKGLPIKTKWRLIWLKSKKLAPAALAYLDFLEIKKEEIIKDNFGWINEY